MILDTSAIITVLENESDAMDRADTLLYQGKDFAHTDVPSPISDRGDDIDRQPLRP